MAGQREKMQGSGPLPKTRAQDCACGHRFRWAVWKRPGTVLASLTLTYMAVRGHTRIGILCVST